MTGNEKPIFNDDLETAKKLVAERIGFFRHVAIYIVANILLFVFNIIVSPDFRWFVFPLGGWGIGLLAHFVNVFVISGERLERWRRKEIEREIEKLRKKS